MSLVRGPLYGLMVYVYVFYAHPPDRWWGKSLPSVRWAFFAAIVTLASVIIHRYRQKGDNDRLSFHSLAFVKVFILFVIWLWIQSFWAEVPKLHSYFTLLYTKYLLLMYLVYVIIDNEEKLLFFAAGHLLGCFYLGWLAYEAGTRLNGVGGPGISTSNQLSAHLATSVLFGGVLLLAKSKYIRFIPVLTLPFILNGIILTNSRGGFVALILGAASLLYLVPKTSRKLMIIYGVLGVLLLSLLVHDQFLERLDSIFVEDVDGRDKSAESRLPIIMSQLEIFKSNPLGAGDGGTGALSWLYLDPIYLGANGLRSSHNTYMSVLVNHGIPGTTLYIILIFLVIKMLVDLKRRDIEGWSRNLGLMRAAAGGGFIVIAVAGMFTDNIRAEVSFWCIAMLLVLLTLNDNKDQSEEESNGNFVSTALKK